MRPGPDAKRCPREGTAGRTTTSSRNCTPWGTRLRAWAARWLGGVVV